MNYSNYTPSAAVHEQAAHFVKMQSGDEAKTAALQYLVVLAIKGRVPNGIIAPRVVIDKLRYEAHDLGLTSEGGIASGSTREDLHDFFSDRNKCAGIKKEDCFNLEAVFNSVRKKLSEMERNSGGRGS